MVKAIFQKKLLNHVWLLGFPRDIIGLGQVFYSGTALRLEYPRKTQGFPEKFFVFCFFLKSHAYGMFSMTKRTP
jgi:hypothetical protein